MNSKIKAEISRKSIHICSLLIPFGFRYLTHNDRKLAFLIMIPLTFIAITIELLRLYNPKFKRGFFKAVGFMLREHEQNNFSGATFLMVASVVCIAFFPVNITFVAISFLAIGDTLAAIIGINYGKRKLLNTKKSLEGSLACFISTFAFALFFVHPVIAFWGALSTTVAEFYPSMLDDNIKIPLFSGVVMTIVNMFI